MKIFFRSSKLKKICSNPIKMQKEYGPDNAKKLMMRLQELKASENLSHFKMLPGPRCHQLKGKRDNQFAADLKHPFRVVFEPYEENDGEIPLNNDGGFDVVRITSILIIEVGDYHGKN